MFRFSATASAVVLAFAISSLSVAASVAAPSTDDQVLQEVVITSVRARDPLVWVADAKAPRQPIPAHDGADYLKTVAGFSVIRKGGTSGDPVFRGMAASRVSIETDGEHVLGGCGARMDPPTAYIFPEVYDRIVIIKGPQTVLQGAGASAASVRFERDPASRSTSSEVLFANLRSSALAGSFGRRDLVGELRAGKGSVSFDLQGTRAEADDFVDGDNQRIHSGYRRWSGNAALGWTPDDYTRLEITAIRSDGEAAYADRGMDGVVFDRENIGAKFERRELSPLVESMRVQAFHNYVDHVMDNFTLRRFASTPMMPAMIPAMMVSNPDRITRGVQLRSVLRPAENTRLTLGVDRQANRHSLRSTMNEMLRPYAALPRVEDARFTVESVYAEATQGTDEARWLAGLRLDAWWARDARTSLSLGMNQIANPTAGLTRRRELVSAFARREQRLGDQRLRAYAGFGYVERFPDYWELAGSGKESIDSASAFTTRPERTGQWDVGVLFNGERAAFAVSAFASRIDDFILVQSGFVKGMRTATVVRNVDANTWGAEAEVTYHWNANWSGSSSVAYTRGRNSTDGIPLAQIPPLEARLTLDYRRSSWGAGVLLRGVAAQNRYVVGQGNIVGQDLGPSESFSVLSIHADWQASETLRVSLGIDNLTDRLYAEHLSRAGAALAGYEQTTRVNEPGRTAWLKVSLQTPAVETAR